MEERIKTKDIIGEIYKAEEEKIDKKIIKINKELKAELKSINIEKAIEESNNPKQLKEIFSRIEDNYNVKITKYNKELYRQGFVDGVNLMLNCVGK